MKSLKVTIFSQTILLLGLIFAINPAAAASKSYQKRVPPVHIAAEEETRTRIIRPFPNKPPPPKEIEIQVQSIQYIKHANNDGPVFSEVEREIPVQDSGITLNKDLHTRVELICKAKHPIKWEFLVNEASVPIYDVHYRRIFHHHNETSGNDMQEIQHQLENPSFNRFEGRVILRGLLESQSGKYCCRSFNARFANNSYQNSANISVFIPGEHIFTTISHTKYINKSEDSVLISCPVSNPDLGSLPGVALQRLKSETIFSGGTRQEWEQIHARYNPELGFLIQKRGNFLAGTYKCKAFRSDIPVIVRVVESDFKNENGNIGNYFPKTQDSFCWNTKSCMDLVRSQRLECFCKDSFALYVNHAVNEEKDQSNVNINRRGNCSNFEETGWSRLSNLTSHQLDWRVHEFLRIGEESKNVCFRDEIRSPLHGSGARVLLRIIKMPKIDTGRNDSLSSSLVNVTIKFDGLTDGFAAGVQLGIEYFDNSSKPSGTRIGDKAQRNRITLLDLEPSSTQLFPLAHYQAIWRNVPIDQSRVMRIHVFQPNSFSFQWFQISSTVVNNDDSSTPNANANTNVIHTQVHTAASGEHGHGCPDSEENENINQTSCKSGGFSLGKYLAISLGGLVIPLLVVVSALIYFRARRQRRLLEDERRMERKSRGFVPAWNSVSRMPNSNVASNVRRSLVIPNQEEEGGDDKVGDANVFIVDQNMEKN